MGTMRTKRTLRQRKIGRREQKDHESIEVKAKDKGKRTNGRSYSRVMIGRVFIHKASVRWRSERHRQHFFPKRCLPTESSAHLQLNQYPTKHTPNPDTPFKRSPPPLRICIRIRITQIGMLSRLVAPVEFDKGGGTHERAFCEERRGDF